MIYRVSWYTFFVLLNSREKISFESKYFVNESSFDLTFRPKTYVLVRGFYFRYNSFFDKLAGTLFIKNLTIPLTHHTYSLNKRLFILLCYPPPEAGDSTALAL